MRIHEINESEAWQKSSGKNKNGGLNAKGVKSYRASHPGSHLQTAVTTKPSKLKKGSKASKRRKSFCVRMKGMKKHRTGAKTKHDPNSRINKSLRKWHCESIEEMQDLILAGDLYISLLKENAVSDLEKDLKDPKSYDAIDHMMTAIAKKHNISPKKLHDEFVEKHGELPDDWISENFADGKKPGRKGLSKRLHVNTKGTAAELEKRAHNATGEKQRMLHFVANMKAGKKKAHK